MNAWLGSKISRIDIRWDYSFYAGKFTILVPNHSEGWSLFSIDRNVMLAKTLPWLQIHLLKSSQIANKRVDWCGTRILFGSPASLLKTQLVLAFQEGACYWHSSANIQAFLRRVCGSTGSPLFTRYNQYFTQYSNAYDNRTGSALKISGRERVSGVESYQLITS